jgi:hypothetical protein
MGSVGALIVAVLAWIARRQVPTAAWVVALVGAAIFVAFAVVQWQTQQRVATYQRRRNERAGSIRDQVVAGANPPRPYFVYLRPFDIDGAFVEAPRTEADTAYVEEYGWPTAHHDLESALALLVYPYGDLVALSDETGEAGAGYVRSTDLSWQDEVRALCEHAEGVFAIPFDFEGTAWEVEMLMEQGWLDKSFFVMPATPPTERVLQLRRFSRDYRALWEAGRARYGALNLPTYDPQGAVVQVGDDARVLRGFGRRLRFADRKRAEHDLETLRVRLAELSASNASPDRGRGVEPRPEP